MATITKNFPIRQHVEAAGVTAGTVEMVFDTVPAGRFQRYDLVTVVNDTNVATLVRLVMRGHGYDNAIWNQRTLAAGYVYWSPWSFLLAEGEYLVLIWTGTTDADALHGYTLGIEGELGDLL